MAAEPWSRMEVEAVVADYRQMLIQQLNGQQYNKSEHRRALQKILSDRSEASIERKHQNISAILNSLNCPYIPGYKPLSNYQALLYEVVVETLVMSPAFDQAALHASGQPAIAPAGIDFGYWIESPPSEQSIKEPSQAGSSRLLHYDYVAREARNAALGLAGEELVLSYEQDRLERIGRGHLAGQVRHVSVTDGDGAGYDILSFDGDGRERFIEVKTTAFAKATPFYISRNEIDFSADNSDSYHLYRLFEFREKPRMFQLMGNMHQRLQLNPVSYLARPA